MALQIRRGTNAERTAVTLAAGELGYTTDTKQLYVGDGTTAGGVSVGGVSDGSKGAILVASNGTVWTITDTDFGVIYGVQNNEES
jgi:hypothetical protein